jgi:hypothetical protein
MTIVIQWGCLMLLTATGFHVTTGGTASGNGSSGAPWDLPTALSHPMVVKAGDTIWIHGGTYTGHFISKLQGNSTQAIVVIGYPGQRAVIDGNTGVEADGALTINGSYTRYERFTVTNSYKGRVVGGSLPVIICGGVEIFGAHNQLVNLLIYDNIGNGIGFWSTATESVIDGCLIFNNGYQGSDRGHGHGIYTQNATGTKYMRDNIIFNGFQYGIHAYTEGGSIKGFQMEGNVLFNNGILQRNGTLKSNILIGGLQPADRVVVDGNHLFQSTNVSRNLELGYSVINESATVRDNTIINGNIAAMVNKWKNITFTGNTVIGASMLVGVDSQGVDYTVYQWNNNTYHGAAAAPFSERTWDSWRSLTGFDTNSTWQKTMPATNVIVVRKSKSVAGRANIVVYNWQKLTKMDVDVSGVIASGGQYEVHDAQNPLGNAVLSGTLSGTKISIPLGQTAIQLPNGTVANNPTHTPTEFNVFVLTGKSANGVEPEPEPEPEDSTSVNEITAFYPNPTSDIVAVEFNYQKEGNQEVSVLDDKGTKVHVELFTTKKGKNKLVMNLAHLANGLYIIKIGTDSKALTCKIVKQHFAGSQRTIGVPSVVLSKVDSIKGNR